MHLRLATLFLLLSAVPLYAGAAKGIPLPANMSASALQRDTAGNLYVGGAFFNDRTGFLTKLSPDGSSVIWSAPVGTLGTTVEAIALSGNGVIYVTGTMAAGTANVGYVAAFDEAGKLRAMSEIAGGALTPRDVTVTPAGTVIVTGYAHGSSFAPTPGSVSLTSNMFLIGLDADLSAVQFRSAAGGTHLATDEANNIYVTGSSLGLPVGPMTPGAYMTDVKLNLCSVTVHNYFDSLCSYQYVAKVSPDASTLIFATYLDGSYGSTPARLIVDSQHNVLLAGSTLSDDYPVTAGALQTLNRAQDLPALPPGVFLNFTKKTTTGYLTKLNSQGTGLIFSTFFGGSSVDSITDFAVGRGGELFISGFAHSADLPGMTEDDATPAQCLPAYYTARLSPNGDAVYESVPFLTALLCANCVVSSQTTFLILNDDSMPVIVAGGTVLATIDRGAPAPAIACVVDSATFQPVTSVVPGQLVSVLGHPDFPLTIIEPKNNRFPTSAAGHEILLNDIAAPLLYTSPRLLNLQVPFELAAGSTARIQLPADSRVISLPVISSNRSLFLTENAPVCEGALMVYALPPFALVLNPDGSRNSCANPVSRGGVVTVFSNGLGAVDASQRSGQLTTSPIQLPTPISQVPAQSTVRVLESTSVPGSIDSVWQTRIQMGTDDSPGPVNFNLDSGGVLFRGLCVVWTK